jgi:hypothetical protein
VDKERTRQTADLPNVQLFRNWALGRFRRKTATAR